MKRELKQEVVIKVLKYLKAIDNGQRMRAIAWRIKENPYEVLDALTFLQSKGLVESISYSDPANMEYYLLWKIKG